VHWKAAQAPAPGSTAARERWPKSLRIFKAALETALAEHGAPLQVQGSTVMAVAYNHVREEFVATYPADGSDAKDKQHTKRQALFRALTAARTSNLINSREVEGTDYVWLTTPGA
jgi:hypothetical protein